MKLRVFCFCILWSLNTLCQDKMPDGVVYKQKGKQENSNAYESFKNSVLNKRYATINNDLIYIGPNLWDRYKKIPSIAKIQNGNVTFKVPLFDVDGKRTNVIEKTGKLIQSIDDFKKIVDQLSLDFKVGKLSFRKLNFTELEYYWSIIFYDITDPLFIVETQNHKILVQLDEQGQKVIWLDETL